MDEVRSLTKELLNLPDRFEILYLQGGASLGFLTTAYNLIPEGGSAAPLQAACHPCRFSEDQSDRETAH